MTPDEMERAIYETFIEGYDATPALELRFRICANRAAERIVKRQGSNRVVAMKRRTPDEERQSRNIRMAEAYLSGKTLDQVGRQFGVQHSTVWMALEDMGIERRPRGTRVSVRRTEGAA